MTRGPGALIARLCHVEHLEALLGDLDELCARRARRRGPAYARVRFWLDVVSALVHQSRVRHWTKREWTVAWSFAVMMVAVFGGAGTGGYATAPYTITATDAAGVFTLEMSRGRVLAATMDGQPLPAAQVVQDGSVLTLRGADPSNDLRIQITSDGGIRWEGRPASSVQDSPINLEWARAYFAEADSVSAADAAALWGVALSGPMLFVERGSRTVVANTPDSAAALREQDGVWVGTLPAEVGIANTAVEWSGRRWTMVMWPVPSQGYARRRLLMHESFHRVQPALGFEMRGTENAHLASRDGRILTRLEWRALAEALVRRGEARKRAIEDALAFRARRYALFPGAADEERALELNEGLAEYTGLRLGGLPADARATVAARDLLRRESAPNFARSFAYATGPAYGMLLDAADPAWRGRVREAHGLGALLGAAYGVSPADTGDVEARAERYDGGRVIAEETQAAERALAEQARLRAAFVEGPTLTLPVGGAFHYSFDPNRVLPLDGYGTVYAAAEIRDEWGLLTVESGGVLMRRQARSITGVVVPAAGDTDGPPTAGDGWRLELAEGWEVRPGDRPGDWVVARR